VFGVQTVPYWEKNGGSLSLVFFFLVFIRRSFSGPELQPTKKSTLSTFNFRSEMEIKDKKSHSAKFYFYFKCLDGNLMQENKTS